MKPIKLNYLVYSWPKTTSSVYQVWDASCCAAEEPSCHPLTLQHWWSGLDGEYCTGTGTTEPETLPMAQKKQIKVI